MLKYLIWVWLVLSLIDFIFMGWDKRQAKKSGRRIPEKRFFVLAVLGGTPGAIAGMYVFHHKTKHWYFKWGLPAILVVQLVIGGLLAYIIHTR